ncbi:Vitamin B12 dependent methionine synthase activation subunit [Desulfotomaculum sp. 1211_IL3151]|uniref:Vitamin B12 dependent methionine synthase activation subunit n=1 Tax=Desulfotomaculum sp. 1211_IL3151 TaxID=3084055 RepID=UPI002FD8E4EE
MLLPQIALKIPPAKVLRYLGIKNSTDHWPELLRQIEAVIQAGKVLATPTAAITQVPFCLEQQGVVIGSMPDLVLGDAALRKISAVSVVAVTVGEAIEQEVTRLFNKGETTKGVIMDAVGTVAVEELSEQVIGLAARQMGVRGLYATAKLGPGYQDMPLEYLPAVLQLAEAWQINITCNEFCQMKPSKSLCFFIGWVPEPPKIREKCDLCQKADCLYRCWNGRREEFVL